LAGTRVTFGERVVKRVVEEDLRLGVLTHKGISCGNLFAVDEEQLPRVDESPVGATDVGGNGSFRGLDRFTLDPITSSHANKGAARPYQELPPREHPVQKFHLGRLRRIQMLHEFTLIQ